MPIFNIPGFTCPVREFFFEDLQIALESSKKKKIQKSGWDPVSSESESDGDAEISLPIPIDDDPQVEKERQERVF